ncbi:hypothetical protein ED28_02840 [[Pantoea] beijingensis]|uniref:Arc family DNA-binding protein n=1 Tax=[Pantoea] beijingensis TaxID=1324864 RepID=A0A443IIU5_9GAMM|nr:MULTISPECIES: hypothetical protein [Erwiniaceae]RWR03941.1 hypothetical protein ED28_02840 [[Pantoea] beijingensis]
MTDTVSLTIKIDPTLKETLKSLALENQISVSQEITQRLLSSLAPEQPPVIDNSHTEEEPASDLTSGEIKQLRALLKKQRKKK